MGDKMSQEEIDMLINQSNDKGTDKSKKDNVVNEKNNKKAARNQTSLYKTIDFRKPNKLQYDNLGAMQQIHEQFSKLLSNYLTMFLRSNIQADVDFEIIEQISYKQYTNMGHPRSLWGIYSMGENTQDDSKCFIQFDAAFCDFFIDRSFGGSAEYSEVTGIADEKMSDINKEISKALFSNVLAIYEQAWNNSNITSFNMHMHSIEDGVRNLNLSIMSSEMILIIPIELSIFQKKDEEDEGTTQRTSFNIGIPYSAIEPILDKLNISNILSSHPSEAENEAMKVSLQKMNNLIEVYVGETEIKFNDLLELAPGDIISLEKKKTDPYSIHINGVKKYEAKPYRNNKKICLKITK